MPPSRDLQEFTDSGSGVRPPEPKAEDPPAQVGRYEIKHELARGGMGVVYVAHDPDLDRPVAIKQLLGRGEKHRKRFQREAKAVARLQHPNIVRVYDVAEEDDGRLYMVMDLIEGESLGERLERLETLEPHLAARIAWQTAQALQYAHQAGILHRDVKPGNVLLDPNGEVKLTDFGLAKSFDLTDESLTLDATPEGGIRPITDMKMTVGVRSLTADGHVMGTPAYMSPEQAKGEKLDPRSDVFSLGSTLYQMLVGEPPFTAPRLTTLLKSVLHDAPDPIRKQRPEVPKELERICLRCLEKKPDKRYPDAESLARDLRAFLDGGRKKAPIKKRRRSSDAAVPSASSSSGVRQPIAARLEELPPWASWVALGGFVLLGIGAGVIASMNDDDPELPPVVVQTEVPPIEPVTKLPDDGLYRYQGRTVAEWVADLGSPERVPRVAAAQALATIGPPHAASARAALRSVLGDPDEAVARYAARALAKLTPTQAALEPLDKLAHRRLGEPAAADAVAALRALGPSAVLALGGLLDRPDLRDRSPALERDVAAALADLAPRAVDIVLKALSSGPTSRERRTAAGVLGRLGREDGKRAVPALSTALNDAFEAVGIRAAEALGAIGDPRATLPLTRALTSGGPLLTRAAAKALSALGGHAVEDAVTALVHSLGAPRAEVREQALAALRAIPSGTTRAGEAIARLRRRDRVRAARAQAALEGRRPAVVKPPPARAITPIASRFRLSAGPDTLNAYRARRTRPGKLRGGERAIAAALDWLARHQGADGAWSAARFNARCSGRRCSGDGAQESFDAALTGLALLAFLGHGHTHRGGAYAVVVQRALNALARSVPATLSRAERPHLRKHYHGVARTRTRLVGKTRMQEWVTQPLSGWPQAYELAIAGAALREAAAMTGDPALTIVSRRVRGLITAAQNPGLGWGYGPRTGRNDSSITCWMLSALLADPADRARVRPHTVSGWDWLRRASDRSGNVGYDFPGGGSSFLQKNLVRRSNTRAKFGGRFQLPTLAAHTLLVADLDAKTRPKKRTRAWLKTLRKQVPRLLLANQPRLGADTTSYYYWFVGSHALADYPREWGRWRRPLVRVLTSTQRPGGCARGSWEPVGEWCQVGGRVYATAINALTLQAPYRLKPE